MLEQMTLPGMSAPTSSPGSEDGSTPLNSQAGPQASRSGPAPVRASRSRQRERDLAPPTLAISGPSLDALSPSAVLQSSLESRLRARLEGCGSPEYDLTWKHWDMPSGPPILARRASGHRTSGSGSTGWPSAGWHSPVSADSRMCGDMTNMEFRADGKPRHDMVSRQAFFLAGWSTPCTPRDNDSDYSAFRWNPNKKQDDPTTQLLGRTTPLSSVPMEKRGALNPEFVRWLMGYPAAWGSCAATATQSSRKSRQRS